MTRGTTAPNRLRRVDRWLVRRHGASLRDALDPLVVDLGYGRHPVTVVELAQRLAVVRPDVDVHGLEIDPERVAAARALVDPDLPGPRFDIGGFELGPLGDRRPVLVRAFNVLRQYEEHEVAAAWALLRSRLAPGGVVVEGTCDEPGRLASWVVLDGTGPRSLVLAWRLAGLDRPGAVAARLPKALIHRNVPGERVHGLLAALDEAWEREAPVGSLGARQRMRASVARVVEVGWPVRHDPAGWREGVVEVPWAAVSPLSGPGAPPR